MIARRLGLMITFFSCRYILLPYSCSFSNILFIHPPSYFSSDVLLYNAIGPNPLLHVSRVCELGLEILNQHHVTNLCEKDFCLSC